MKSKILIFIHLCLLQLKLQAQHNTVNDYPVIGLPCPKIVLDNVEYYPRKQISTDDLRNKWLVLDFWSKGCIACVASFPKISELQKEFVDDVQFILIGKNDRQYNHNIRALYEDIKKQRGLDIVVAYDSLIFKRFQIQAVPYVLIIDRDGIVREITNTQGLNKQKLEVLMH